MIDALGLEKKDWSKRSETGDGFTYFGCKKSMKYGEETDTGKPIK